MSKDEELFSDLATAVNSMLAKSEIKVCSLCQQHYTGYGNNAWPAALGRCCDDCNTSVIQLRLLNAITEAKRNG